MSTITVNVTYSVAEGIVAYATGGQANATELTKHFNYVDMVATANDSVKCDAATVGKVREVFNSTANDMYLYPKVGERFKNSDPSVGLMAINDPIVVGAGGGVRLICITAGQFRF